MKDKPYTTNINLVYSSFNFETPSQAKICFEGKTLRRLFEWTDTPIPLIDKL